MAHNGIFIILDSLLSLISPICISSPLFFSLTQIIISFSFSTYIFQINQAHIGHKERDKSNRQARDISLKMMTSN